MPNEISGSPSTCLHTYSQYLCSDFTKWSKCTAIRITAILNVFPFPYLPTSLHPVGIDVTVPPLTARGPTTEYTKPVVHLGQGEVRDWW